MTGGKARQIILVTGAPRSGTTPVGHIIAQLPQTATLYEPMGPTGDRRFEGRYPIVGEPGFGMAEFDDFLADLKTFNLKLKPQERPYFGQLRLSLRQRAARKIMGSQSLRSLTMARLQSPWTRNVLWKDPNAALSARAAARHGVKVVVCLRSPEAVAGSFKRNRWVSDIEGIYRRYAAVRGSVPDIAAALAGTNLRSPVQTASMLWHLIYHDLLAAVREEPNMVLVDPLHMERDEEAEYRRILGQIGLDFVEPMRRAMMQRTERRASPLGVHDWSRSLAETNSYWRSVLDEAEIDFCRNLNGPLWATANSYLQQQGHRPALRPAS